MFSSQKNSVLNAVCSSPTCRTTRSVRHSFGDPVRNGCGVLVPDEAGAFFVRDRVHHPERVGLAAVAVALEGQLPAADRLLGQADLPADAGDFWGKFKVFEDGLERGTDPADPVTNLCQGILELLLVGHPEGEVGGGRLHRLDPHRIAHALRRVGVPFGVNQAEPRILLDHLLLLEAAPVLVLALHHRLQARAAQPPESVTQDRDHGAHRKVPEPDNRVDRSLEGFQLTNGLVQQIPQHDLLTEQLLEGQQRVEVVLLGIGHIPQNPFVVLVEAQHQHVHSHQPSPPVARILVKDDHHSPHVGP